MIEALKREGAKWIVSATASTIAEAVKSAIAELPIPIEKATEFLFDIRCGKAPNVADMTGITSALPEGANIDVKWGLRQDKFLADNIKVVILAVAPL